MSGEETAGQADAAAGARLTPYELVFADTELERDGFPALREEAEARGADVTVPERLLLLATAGRLLRELGATDATLEPVGMLLFQAYHFWDVGKRVYVLEPALARALAEGAPGVLREIAGRAPPAAAAPHAPAPAAPHAPAPAAPHAPAAAALHPPAPAGYLQLPRNLFWARVDEAATPEPVDGLFWTMAREGDAGGPPARLDLLLALGLWPGRPGLSVIPVAEPLAGRSLADLALARARPDGADFANVLPGGELEGLFALTTPAEVLKLFALVWSYVERHPDAVGDAVAPPEPAPASSPHALPPSRLPYHPIRRVAVDG
ncbi:MAG TPA: hypothetical protein VF192_14515 [Longimicrobiales bacterium]